MCMQPSSQILLKDFWSPSNLCQAHGEMSAVLQQGGGFAELLGQEGLSLLLNPDPLAREEVAPLLLSKALGLTSQSAASLTAEDTGGILPGSPAAQRGWGSVGHGEPCSHCCVGSTGVLTCLLPTPSSWV